MDELFNVCLFCFILFFLYFFFWKYYSLKSKDLVLSASSILKPSMLSPKTYILLTVQSITLVLSKQKLQ